MNFVDLTTFKNITIINFFSNMTLFTSITMLCGTNNIIYNISHVRAEY